MLLYIIIQHPDINVSVDDSGWNYFHYLVHFFGRSCERETGEKIVSLLLEISANPNLQNNNRRRSLIIAIKKIGYSRLIDQLNKKYQEYAN